MVQLVDGGIWGWNSNGANSADLSNCYYLKTKENGMLVMKCGINNGDVSDTSKIQPIDGENNMKTKSFVNSLNGTNESTVWEMDINNINRGYPVLNWQND